MTRRRWLRLGELFAGALRVDPPEREAWLRRACDEDEGLRAAAARLLDEAERMAQDGLLSTPEPSAPARGATVSWPRRGGRRPRPSGREPIAAEPAGHVAGVRGFSPKAAIAAGSRRAAYSEPASVVRARLRELPMIYVLFLAMASFWRWSILGDDDRVLHYVDATTILVLGGVIALLSGYRAITLARLRALELGVIGVLAARVAFVEYRLVLIFSLRGDPMMAQLTVKNFVLLTAVLLLTYGLYVPKGWRRAVLVAGPLALLPFAVLLILYALHPGPMSWLGRGWGQRATSGLLLLGFDAMTLILLALGAALGALAISRLRRQVAEARQLGQYRLGKRIGAGGMGEVYLAEHQLLKRPCAVKLIRPDGMADPRTLARFEREVRLTATLSHPNTVEVYDYGRTEAGVYYYVMEYLPGLNLAELVERHGALPPGRAVYLLRQVCGSLGEAHAAGLIHRDIKPSNIFISRQGGVDDVAKLLDFGLALPPAGYGGPEVSGEGGILGTPQFMSPEQAQQSVELDGRSDIYSLGAVAYFVLTGRPPFGSDDGLRLLIAHVRDPVVPPSMARRDIPADLEQVVLRCLAKDPAERFPDAKSLGLALSDCACAGDWDEERATRWWRDADRSVPTGRPSADSWAGGSHDRASNTRGEP